MKRQKQAKYSQQTINFGINYPFLFLLTLKKVVSGAFIDCVKLVIKILYNFSSSKLRNNSPFLVQEIAPVSSDTIIVSASVTSLIPKAARCLVPNSFEIVGLSDKGK